MKDRIDRAAEVIKGYCSKIPHCNMCRYGTENGECRLTKAIPADWNIEKEKPQEANEA